MSNEFTFAPATLKHVKFLGAFDGPSGSGKTLTALLMARGLVGQKGRIAVVDTENGRAAFYKDDVPGGYDVLQLKPPFNPERFVQALRAAEDARYDALVFDSFSMEWEGQGGVLDMADNGKNRAGRPLEGLAKWLGPKKAHRRLRNELLQSPLHLFLTFRSKPQVKQVRDPETGRETIVKDGWKISGDAEMIYDMTFQLHMENQGESHPAKVPMALKETMKPGSRLGIEAGKKISDWLGERSIDWDIEALKREGRDMAQNGMAALKTWFTGLGKQEQAALKPHLDNLKALAAEADNAAGHSDEPAGEPQASVNPFTKAA
jgi:DNA polymerase III delta prime subunit